MGKRDQILQSAEIMFLKHGLNGVNMVQIAEQAKVSKQTVYSHFNSKDELFTAVLTSKCPVQKLPDDFFSITEPRESLLKLGHFAAGILLNDEGPRLFRLCISISETRPDLSLGFFENGPGTLIQHLTNYFIKLTDAGILNVDHPRLAASQFLMSIRGETGLRLDLNIPPSTNAAPIDFIVERCVDMFLSYYSVK